MKTAEERFEEKVDRSPHPNGCVVWTGAVSSSGYGHLLVSGKLVKAHRFAYEQKNGPLADGMCALHKCDTPLCVNDDHLYEGTKKRNALDREERKRGNHPTGAAHPARRIPEMHRGHRNGRAKMDEAKVRAMRQEHLEGATCTALAKKYGLTKTTVSNTLRGKLWGHVEG